MENLADFDLTVKSGSVIKVIGVGGGGGNAVNHMCKTGIHDVDFVVCNTDAQALQNSPVRNRVQLGATLTEGRGAGNKPEIGRQAALENIEDVKRALADNTKMVFVTAGMGGGTGTGAAPVIAQACKEEGYLTVAIVTIPFRNEGRRRIRQAIEGIKQLEQYVDSLLVINNENICEMYGDFSISEAFARADNILATAAKGIAEIITVPGHVNVDFADVETVMRRSGRAVMGTGIATGEDRALEAVELALNSPLLNHNDIRGARNILIHINSGTRELTMGEIRRVNDYVQERAGFDADIIWGNGTDEKLGEELSVTVIATGLPGGFTEQNTAAKPKVEKVLFDGEKLLEETEKTGTESRPSTTQEKSSSGKTIEFDIQDEIRREENEFDILYPNTSRNRKTSSKLVKLDDVASLTDEEMADLENVPAYKRRQMKISNAGERREESNYSVNRKNEISDRNSYLHDKVD